MCDAEVAPIQAALRDWYRRHARDLPWRVPPAAIEAGARPDPYRVWLSEIMLQQTTVAAVRDKYLRFTALWPDIGSLAAAPDPVVMAEWAGLGYYARARNLLKCARVVSGEYNGVFPDSYDALLTLPGIGPYTAAAIAAIAFDRPETVVDGNVERVMARLFDIHTPLPAAKPELTARAATLTPRDHPGNHAQAVMDLGATICTPRSPACGICPVVGNCAARRAGHAASLPRKAPKPVKPTRFGTAYVGRTADGALLLETRPAKGLLGGMQGWPGTDWTEAAAPPANPPVPAVWTPAPAEVRHTFTHFHLRLAVETAEIDGESRPAAGRFVPAAEFQPSALPTVMRKVWTLARTQFPPV